MLSMPSALSSTVSAAKSKKSKSKRREILAGVKAEFLFFLGAPWGGPSGLFPSQVLFKLPLPESEESRKGEVKPREIWTGSHGDLPGRDF